jgi:hypothetical protein
MSDTWPFVREFAVAMEIKLLANKHKGGPRAWSIRDVDSLLRSLDKEVKELRAAVRLTLNEGKIQAVQQEAVDVANFAMMISSWYGDNCAQMREEQMIIV